MAEKTSTTEMLRSTGTLAAEQRSPEGEDGGEAQRADIVDFKMVTFSLGGKDYGIDIMKVKEIAKIKSYTYVPNTPHFVRGVYNLRGDIISVLDLRRMFNLPVEEKEEGQPEDGLILRLEENLPFGVIVDRIDRVVGISRERIQPPHPIFADINLKYISGVVEHENRLYIILDVDRILAKEEEAPEASRGTEISALAGGSGTEEPGEARPAATGAAQPSARASETEDPEALTFEFVSETLATFAGFYVSDVNKAWMERRFGEWVRERQESGQDTQLSSAEDAAQYLRDFYSPHTGAFWPEAYGEEFRKLLPSDEPRGYTVWNPGCAKGFETYSLACILRSQFPEARLKIWAHDNDLLSVSTAPNLVVPLQGVPELHRKHMVAGKNGYAFSQEIQDLILFEYHDITSTNAIPEVDLIVARDVLSFLPVQQQQALLSEFSERLKEGGILVIGKNEELPGDEWKAVELKDIRAYRLKDAGG